VRRVNARTPRARLARVAAWAVAIALCACASAGAPPGGPERHTPPEIVSISPDSGETSVKIRDMQVKFDEVVNERPSGTATSLDQLFLVSPRDGTPNVSWHRDRITVRPRKGFRANTAYRVTMLPGLSDLRGNVRKEGFTVLFSTGTTFPAFSIPGRVFDWDQQRPAIGAYIEATSLSDTTLVYVTATDTSGQFDAGPLPAGSYRVRALIDANSNRALDRNEKWDTTTVTISNTRPVIELDATERDSTPPAISDVRVDDSVTMHVMFDKSLAPSLVLGPDMIRVVRADSTPVQVRRVQFAAAFDRARQVADSARRADSTAAARRTDTSAARRAAPPPATAPPTAVAATPGGRRPAPPPPKPRAPAPERAIVVIVAPETPLTPGSYVISAHGFRNLAGNASDLRRGFVVKKPAPPDSTRTRADSTRRGAPPATRPAATRPPATRPPPLR
jgi:hypothetical protein